MPKEPKKNPNLQDQTNIDTDLFAGGMTKDPNASIQSKEHWTHARNAINNSDKGDLGTLGNEPSNLFCTDVTYPIIGTVYLYGDKWVIFSTDNNTSEIGIFDDSECLYTPVVNDSSGSSDQGCTPEHCLNFSQQYLITGASKENFDCTWQVYWDDGLNPSRTMNLTNIPWKTERVENGDCVTYEPIEPKQIDCDLIRLAPLLDTPNIALSKSDNGGQLRNGSYQAFIAYTINGQQIGDYIGISNVQSLFDHEDMVGALDIKLSGLDKGEFEEFKLVILSNWQQEQQAKEIGLYSVETLQIGVDYINQSLPTVPIEFLPLRNPAYEKSEKMYVVNDYLIRSGPTERFDFNYQPLANQIETHWTSTEVPADYYANGGNKTNFMRDEVYSFFIRWIYDTGEKSSSYHIPGRAASEYDIPAVLANTGVQSVDQLMNPGDPNCLDPDEKVFQTYNTAGWGYWQATGPFPTDDGGFITFRGSMGYWESTERYPMDPVRWNANIGNPDLDLCGKPIRHHKFPTEQTGLVAGAMGPCTRSGVTAQSMRIMGVKFSNIHLPRLNPETIQEECEETETDVVNLVPGIVGYEILVGSRAGNKSIIAKGIARNMRNHRLPPDAAGNKSHESIGNMQAVHANYPFNDIGCDPFLHNPGGSTDQYSSDGLGDEDDPPEWAYGRNNSQGIPHPSNWSKQNMFTFHSPETSFDRPFLSPYELHSYGLCAGGSYGLFKKSEKHPGEKLINTTAAVIAIIIGVGYAIAKTRGKRRVKFDYPQTHIPLASASAGGAIAASVGLAGGNAAGLAITQAGTAVSESVHTGSAILGAPGLGQEAAQLFNTGTAWGAQALMSGGSHGGGKTIEYDRSGSFFSELPSVFQPIYGVIAFMQSVAEGGNHILELIYNLCSYVDYAYKFNGHGLYRATYPFNAGDCWRTKVEKARYVKNTITNLSNTVRMNNLFRPATVAVLGEDETNADSHVLREPRVWIDGFPLYDNSRHQGTMQNCNWPSMPFMKNILAHYCGLKLNFENQYGQLDQIKQIPITNSEYGNGYHLLSKFLDRDANDEIIPPDINTTLWSWSLYGGDTYVNRYTEKVIMPFFWDFLKGQPNGFVYDYRLRANVMFPMFWANFERYDLSKLTKWITDLTFLDTPATLAGAMPYGYYHLDNCDGGCAGWSGSWGNDQAFFSAAEFGDASTGDSLQTNDISGTQGFETQGGGTGNLLGLFTGGGGGSGNTSTFSSFTNSISGGGTPNATSDTWNADDSGDKRGKGLFHIKDGYFYTHSSGIQDFFVESEYNIALRDYEDTKYKRHYDWLEFTDINTLFTADVLSAGNFYKYDKALSISNLVTQQISSGDIQPRYYDPKVAETCWTHYPKRLIYSLQAQKEATKDFWRVFLPNNYKDFKNKVNVIKPVSKSGAVILFPHLSPMMWQGVDQLQTDLGTKITIGDGGLFSQPQQNIVNADLSHEYGSCESSRGVINTPTGLFYISQQQGKIFHMAGQGLLNIADQGMKQWFNEYLPSKLIQDFPELENHPEWSDNPIAGAGCQAVYDPNYDLVYFCKKDYKLISNHECVEFIPGQGFVYNATLCDGAAQTQCCPEGFSIIPELSTMRCSRDWWVSPSPTNEIACKDPYDIIFVIYGGDRISNPTGVNNPQFSWGEGDANNPAWQTLRDTMTYTFQGLADNGQLGPGADDSQVMIMQFDNSTGLDNHYIDYTGNLGTLLDFANNGYMNPDYVSEGGVDNIPEGSDPSGATWWALEWGYRKGRPGVKKMLIEIWAAYDAVCTYNWSGIDDNDYPDLPSCNGCTYAGFDSPASYIEDGTNWTPIAPPMVNIIADNIGEPGSLGFDRGLNDYGLNNAWLTPEDETLFVGPVCSPQEQGAFDNYLDWKNDNVFDASCRYQNPNHPDFDGELTVIGVWYSPWNYCKCTNDGASNNGCNMDPNVSGSLGYPNNHPSMVNNANWNIGAAPTQGNIDYTVARSSPGHAIWSPMSPGPNQGATALYGENVASEILGLIPCELEETEGLECPVGCNLTETSAGQMECYCSETLGEPAGFASDTLIDISLTDTEYFEDVSWTISYDPKNKAWMSFHDWHPELVMPSYSHFLTTKSTVTQTPSCPPGWTFSSTSQMCERDGEYYGLDSIITVDDIKAPCMEPTSQMTGRKLDIIFSLDVSWSTVRNIDVNADLEEGPPISYEGTIYKSQLEFIDAFAVAMTAQMAANEVQIGIIPWNDQVVLAPMWLYYPEDDITKLDLTNNLSAIRTFLGVGDGFTNPNYSQGFLAIAGGNSDVTRGFDAAKGGLDYILKYPTAGTNNQGNSYLGSRQGENSFERHAIFVTDTGPEGITSLALKISNLESNDDTGLIDTSSECFKKAMENLFWGTGNNGLYAFNFDRNNTISPNVDEGFADPPLNTPSTSGYGLQAQHWMDMVRCECTQNVINGDGISPVMSNYNRAADPTMNINITAVFTNPDNEDNSEAYTKNVFPILKSFNESSVPVWDLVGNENSWGNIAADGSEYLNNAGEWEPFSAISSNVDSFVTQVNSNAADLVDQILPFSDDNNDRDCRRWCPDPERTLVWLNGSNYSSPNKIGNVDKAVCRKVTCECDPIIQQVVINNGWNLYDPNGDFEGTGVTNVVGDCPDFDPLIYAIGDPNFSFWDWDDYRHPHCCVTEICHYPPSYDVGGIWKHNIRCDSYANYYGIDYPWEIEWVEGTGQHVYTLRNVEYQMESYIYKGALANDCGDRFHDLDWNFDEAVIYNTEQVSGLLKLNLTPKNNVPLITQYPIIGANDIEILYSKEEQVYRFNQFWDITFDRGEFNPGISNSIYLTQLNGYIRDLNAQNLNYNKPALQRKKFRHYWNKVLLRKNVSGNRKMILKLANTKLNKSHR